MNNNHPPFRVGQRVVALRDSNTHVALKKGDIVTVVACIHNCCSWRVLIEEFPAKHEKSKCVTCGAIWNHLGLFYLSGNAKYFAPIDPLYVDITKELAEKGTTEETPDVIKIKELAN